MSRHRVERNGHIIDQNWWSRHCGEAIEEAGDQSDQRSCEPTRNGRNRTSIATAAMIIVAMTIRVTADGTTLSARAPTTTGTATDGGIIRLSNGTAASEKPKPVKPRSKGGRERSADDAMRRNSRRDDVVQCRNLVGQ
jgi:hypothetical protein